MSMFGTKNNGKLSSIQKSLIVSLAAHAMAIIAHRYFMYFRSSCSAPFGFYNLFQESWPRLMIIIIIKKELLKKLCLLTSDFVCHVFGMGAAFTLLCEMMWGETVLSSRTDMYFQSSVDKDCGKLLSSRSQSFWFPLTAL